MAESLGDSMGCLLRILASGQAVCSAGSADKDCDLSPCMLVRACFASDDGCTVLKRPYGGTLLGGEPCMMLKQQEV